MTFRIRTAERRQARLRLALIGPSGSGKTLSSLLIAYGLAGRWAKVGLIDTEQGSGELYEGEQVGPLTIGRYAYGRLTAPFTAATYLEAIHAIEGAVGEGGVVILDSLSHAWAGEGGILDKVDRLTERGNKFAAWRHATPDHNSLVEAILQSPAHVIACMRAKTEYVQEKDDHGKTVVRKVGLAPVQRDGLEYEFTCVMDLDAQHVASASKDRTRLFDGQLVKPTPEMGRQFRSWLERGAAAQEAERPGLGEPAPPQAKPTGGDEPGTPPTDPIASEPPTSPVRKGSPLKITEPQDRAVKSIARSKGMTPQALEEFVRRHYNAPLDGLDIEQAAQLIKDLQRL